MKATHSQLRVVCAWCNEVMREGRGPEKDQISHGCCCSCKNKYFPTMGSGSQCYLEVINREHERVQNGNRPGYVDVHEDTVECRECKRVETLEPYDCDCSGFED
jgi:hypothetical protein